MLSKEKREKLKKLYCYQGKGNGTTLIVSKYISKKTEEVAKKLFKNSEIIYK